MHLVVTNIPESFRSPDLRNFFSEYIEKETFHCFHFRHRPQSQLSHLYDDSSKSTSSVITNTQVEQKPQENDSEENVDKNEDMSENTAVESSCKTLTSEPGNTKSHWLNSGLSGLSALINEKKVKAKTDLKQNLQALREGRKSPSESEGPQDGEARTRGAESVGRTCCILNIKDEYGEKFISKYNKKHWVNRSGDVLLPRCFIFRINFNKPVSHDDDYKTRRDLDSQSLSVDSSLNLIEFSPPPIMPQGNVGTPTQHFKTLIRTCQLPGTIIKKLGLEFPRSRGQKRFSQVPFNYGTNVNMTKESDGDEEGIAFTAAGHLIPSSADFTKSRKKPERKKKSKGPKMELEDEKEDGAEIEEWERYEAFHNDVTSQDRTKERLYEKEIELVWEKGGPGLVFYTDAQYWREQEGDFDEQTADEWDVDMSGYYDEGAGDRDAQDSIAMLHSNKLRSGKLSCSAFTTASYLNAGKREIKKDMSLSASTRKRKIGPSAPPAIGKFEAHTRGFGRRLLEAQGWQDGQGLGKDAMGLPYALDNDGQHPHDKKGFGYYGEKLQGWGRTSTSQRQQSSRSKQRRKDDICIATVFDHPQEVDPPSPTLRTHEPTTLSHRHKHVSFNRASDSK